MRVLKVGLVCGLGAFIGTLIALQINGFFWWTGLLIGALFGYLAIDLKEVKHAIPRAWDMVTKNKLRMRHRFWGTLSTLNALLVIFSLFFWMFMPLLFLGYDSKVQYPLPILQRIFAPWSFLILLLLVTMANFVFGILTAIKMEELQYEVTEENVKKLRKSFFAQNLLLMFLCYPLFYYAWWLIRRIPMVVISAPKAVGIALRAIASFFVTIYQFIKTVFILIHSDIRVLCAIDAAIGTILGYSKGNALLGAAAGFFVGIFNYLVVAVLILKRQPLKTQS